MMIFNGNVADTSSLCMTHSINACRKGENRDIELVPVDLHGILTRPRKFHLKLSQDCPNERGHLFTVAVLAMWALMKGFLIVKLLFRRHWAKNVLSAIAVLMFTVIFWTHSMHPENESLSLRNNLHRRSRGRSTSIYATKRGLVSI